MEPNRGNDEGQVIATMSGRCVRRWCWRLALPVLFVILLGPLVWFAARSPGIPPESRLLFRFVGPVFTGLALISVGVQAWELLLRYRVRLHDGRLVVGFRRWVLWSIALDNIAEVHVFRASGWAGFTVTMGWSSGSLGLLLLRPEVTTTLGGTRRLMPRINRLLSGAHVFVPPLYHEPADALAAVIADAATARRGVRIPVLTPVKDPGLYPIARPIVVALPATAAIGVLPPAPPLGLIACLKCGYDVRAQGVDGRCPECGMPVARSMQGRFLRTADARWLLSLRQATLVVAASLALLAGVVTAIYEDWIAWKVGVGPDPPSALQLGALLVSWAGFCFGVLWLARRPVDCIASAREEQARRRLLGSLIVPVIGVAALLASAVDEFTLVAASAGFFFLIGAALALFLRQVFQRVPSPTWSAITRVFAALYVIVMLELLVLLVLRGFGATGGGTLPSTAGTRRPPPSASTMMALGAALVPALVLPNALMCLRLWIHLHHLLRDRTRKPLGSPE